VTKDEIHAAMKAAADGPMKGVIYFLDEPLVSCDIVGNSHSSIYDSELTKVLGGNLVKVIAWYDNEYGYSSRLADLVTRMG
jgi:glyceraldehyde 3-phosphate dehydrogenase